MVVGTPFNIKIPSINVDAGVEYVSTASDGTMDVPKNPLNTAWYKLGPQPGEIGSAVINGHVDWENRSDAVFTYLHNLKQGDKVIVQDNQGLVTSFTVRTSRTYDQKADASEIFISNDGKAHLNLITCKGVWDKNSKTYSQRLVVFTDKE